MPGTGEQVHPGLRQLREGDRLLGIAAVGQTGTGVDIQSEGIDVAFWDQVQGGEYLALPMDLMRRQWAEDKDRIRRPLVIERLAQQDPGSGEVLGCIGLGFAAELPG